MPKFSNKTLSAIKDLIDGVDGAHGIRVKHVSEHEPKGEVQECDTGHVKTEWVDQHGPGISGDDFYGTVTWKLGDHYLIAYYAT